MSEQTEKESKKLFGMEDLVGIVNRLQDAFTSVGLSNPIDLPQIVVVGSQSSGKSSVLENLVGRDFLPRGTGIVTRRPLVLQLCQKNNETEEWGEFLHRPGIKFRDFSKIREEIIRDTEEKTGRNKGISPLPINLRIYSPNVLTLTLVDLPGLTKVPVGDQPRDIEKQIRDMALKYITNKNALILAVTAANTDLANSDSLKIARDVDPEGYRTIGVLTKIDLMDKGTDVVDILSGRIIPLQLGYIPVINRGQKDIDANTAIRNALDKETVFFETHPAYQAKAKFCGTSFLAKRLSDALRKHIRKCLPETKAKIAQLEEKNRKELEQLGQGVEGEGQNIFLAILSEFSTDFRRTLDGSLHDISKTELAGGARISFIFHEIFSKAIMAVDPFDNIKDQDIRTLLYNSSGSTPSLFVSTQSFEVLVKQLVVRLEEPAQKCINLVQDELVRILSDLLGKLVFRRFPRLKEKLREKVLALYQDWAEPTRKLVTDIVSAEGGYVNTAHPDFIGGQKAMAEAYSRIEKKDTKKGAGKGISNPFSQAKQARPGILEAPPTILKASGISSDREAVEIEVIKILIESYFNLIKTTIADLIPKTIMLKLVSKAKNDIQAELLKELYIQTTFENLLSESEETISRRRECVRLAKALYLAEKAISSIN